MVSSPTQVCSALCYVGLSQPGAYFEASEAFPVFLHDCPSPVSDSREDPASQRKSLVNCPTQGRFCNYCYCWMFSTEVLVCIAQLKTGFRILLFVIAFAVFNHNQCMLLFVNCPNQHSQRPTALYGRDASQQSRGPRIYH